MVLGGSWWYMTFKTYFIAITFGPAQSRQEPPLLSGFCHINQVEPVSSALCTIDIFTFLPLVIFTIIKGCLWCFLVNYDISDIFIWNFNENHQESPGIWWLLGLHLWSAIGCNLQLLHVHMSFSQQFFHYLWIVMVVLVVYDISGITNCNSNEYPWVPILTKLFFWFTTPESLLS